MTSKQNKIIVEADYEYVFGTRYEEMKDGNHKRTIHMFFLRLKNPPPYDNTILRIDAKKFIDYIYEIYNIDLEDEDITNLTRFMNNNIQTTFDFVFGNYFDGSSYDTSSNKSITFYNVEYIEKLRVEINKKLAELNSQNSNSTSYNLEIWIDPNFKYKDALNISSSIPGYLATNQFIINPDNLLNDDQSFVALTYNVGDFSHIDSGIIEQIQKLEKSEQELQKVKKELEKEKSKLKEFSKENSKENSKDKSNDLNKVFLSFYLKYKDQHPEFFK